MNDLSTSPSTILLVDDEPGILSSLRRLLRPSGYVILTAESGKAGLEILEREPIDLVISDMRMPEMDGAKFLEQVRSRWPYVTRILLTGYADITSTINAINKGEIFRYISKPWNDSDLVLLVRDALESTRLRSENTRLLALTQSQNEELKEFNADLENKVRQRTAEIEQINSFLNLANDKLKQNFLVSIKVFSGLIDLRGGIVSGHSRRVADLVRKLTAFMKIDAKTQHDAFFAALLHDIGKIGFPDNLLSRPVSKMNGDELGLYRKHAAAGEAALMPLDELKDVAKIVRAHHERFDGQGFPDGLEGSLIPLGARILSVINDYDGLQIGSLAEKRMNPDEAKALIIQSRGKRYDPLVIDAFVEFLSGVAQERIPERAVSYPDLKVGMVLSRDLLSRDGVLLLTADFVLDVNLIRQIQDYAHRENHAPQIYIRTDKPEIQK